MLQVPDGAFMTLVPKQPPSYPSLTLNSTEKSRFYGRSLHYTPYILECKSLCWCPNSPCHILVWLSTQQRSPDFMVGLVIIYRIYSSVSRYVGAQTAALYPSLTLNSTEKSRFYGRFRHYIPYKIECKSLCYWLNSREVKILWKGSSN